MACPYRVPLRTVISRALAATLLACTALTSVGLTAPADGLFSITIRTALLQLAVDVDVKIGPMHFHSRWSALSDSQKM